jgi:lipopolysaccharide/colanic/teichoic acid biosynthesis glycosyltransferase
MRTVCDTAAALFLLIIITPLLAAITLLIVICSPGNPFYRAARVGKNGRVFLMWKFRTMVPNAALIGPPVTSHGDSRVTAIGRMLRKTKLDELPQFINVALGDMSMVGPRPETPEIVAFYSVEQRAVLSVKPGITGKTQLQSRDADNIPEAADATTYYRQYLMEPKLYADLEYLRNRTVISDLQILCATAGLVLRSIIR